MQNARLVEAQAGIKIARRNSNNLRYADNTTLMAESEEELDESERGEWKSWLKAQHSKKKKIRSQHLVPSLHANRWEKLEIVAGFIFLGSKITADGDCSHEIKTLAPWKKSYDKPRECIKKQRHYFVNKGLCILKAMVFPVVMFRCESWSIKKAESPKIDAFNCGAGEDSWEPLGHQRDQTSQS